ncbi:uncharacterized protein isoform X3 [Danio rerio]|uniref:Uncharacterized protein isoform X3 n=4 Tax=Danio rerio TaxID=7955 RepID=A0AC58HV77_DANRE
MLTTAQWTQSRSTQTKTKSNMMTSNNTRRLFQRFSKYQGLAVVLDEEKDALFRASPAAFKDDVPPMDTFYETEAVSLIDGVPLTHTVSETDTIDSVTHHNQYPPNTSKMYSYFEYRKKKADPTNTRRLIQRFSEYQGLAFVLDEEEDALFRASPAFKVSKTASETNQISQIESVSPKDTFSENDDVSVVEDVAPVDTFSETDDVSSTVGVPPMDTCYETDSVYQIDGVPSRDTVSETDAVSQIDRVPVMHCKKAN